MSFERQRATALRLVKKNGVAAVRERITVQDNVDQPWKSGTRQTDVVPVHFVAFADDGITFVNHNIQGDVRLLTVVSTVNFDIQAGDVIKTPSKAFTVKLAKPLDPDLSGAILWAALVQ